MIEPEKYEKDGMVAYLISPGFGAGWSTWAHEDGLDRFVLFDKTLVEMRERSAPVHEIEDYIKKATGTDYIYMGGWEDVEVRWMAKGTAFYIHEYDGSESIRTTDNLVIVA